MRPIPRAFVEAPASLGWSLPELGPADRTTGPARLTLATIQTTFAASNGGYVSGPQGTFGPLN